MHRNESAPKPLSAKALFAKKSPNRKESDLFNGRRSTLCPGTLSMGQGGRYSPVIARSLTVGFGREKGPVRLPGSAPFFWPWDQLVDATIQALRVENLETRLGLSRFACTSLELEFEFAQTVESRHILANRWERAIKGCDVF